MALRDYKPRQDYITVNDETVAVRGLTVEDIAILIDAYKDPIVELYAIFEGSRTAKDAEGDDALQARLDRIIVESVQRAPHLVGAIIALAADEPDASEQAKSLPFTVQVDALVKIFTLTFSDVGGLGNFLAVLQGAIAGVIVPLRRDPAAPPSPSIQ